MRMDVRVTNNQPVSTDPEELAIPSKVQITVTLSKHEMGIGDSIIDQPKTYEFTEFVNNNPQSGINNQTQTFTIDENSLVDGSVYVRYKIHAPEGQEQYIFLGYEEHVGRVFVKPIDGFPNNGDINDDLKFYIGDTGTLKNYGPNELYSGTGHFYNQVKEWPYWLINGWAVSDFLGEPYMDMNTEYQQGSVFKTTLSEALRIPFEPHPELDDIAEMDAQGNIRIRVVYNLATETEYIDSENPHLGLKHGRSPTTKLYFKESEHHFIKQGGVHYAQLDLVVERDPDPGVADYTQLTAGNLYVLWFALRLRAEVEVFNPQKEEWSVYDPRINTNNFFIAVATLIRDNEYNATTNEHYVDTVANYISRRDG